MDDEAIWRLRKQIDELDAKIVELLGQRATHAKEIGRLKQLKGMPAYDASREQALMNALVSGNTGPLSDSALRNVFTEIVSACRALQHPPRVSFLGPAATFTHLAAIDYFGQSCDFLPRESIVDVFRDVQSGHGDFGVVPVENSTEGSVGLTLDQLADSQLRICGEVFLRISHALMSRQGSLADIQQILSHPQALAQCLGWLSRNLPGRPMVQMSSTAVAARRASEEEGTAAVGNDMLARLYGLNILARDIQDRAVNVTRFLVLGHEDCEPTGRDRTSILFAVAHHPGALLQTLNPFSEHAINISRIESRPSKDTPWEYVFFADFEGHVSDGEVAATLETISRFVTRLKILGSYPIGEQLGKKTLSTRGAFRHEFDREIDDPPSQV